jgi:hypothetical protein
LVKVLQAETHSLEGKEIHIRMNIDIGDIVIFEAWICLVASPRKRRHAIDSSGSALVFRATASSMDAPESRSGAARRIRRHAGLWRKNPGVAQGCWAAPVKGCNI